MAQKKYVLIYKITYNRIFTLKGDVPTDMQKNYKYTYDDDEEQVFYDIVNMLGERGYELESVRNSLSFIMSRKSTSPASAISRAKSDDGEEAYEVARYNLQGVPVSKNEKGVQIIVYSNYTTKTVIVE